jgi:hypothetical protein
MNDKLFKIIAYALLGVSAIMGVYFFAVTDFKLSPQGSVQTTSGVMLSYTYLLAIIATAAALIFSIVGMAQNPKKAKNALIGVVGLIVIVGISYFLSGSEVYNDLDGNILADAATSKKSEAGLIAFYILGAGAIGSIIYAEVSKMFK